MEKVQKQTWAQSVINSSDYSRANQDHLTKTAGQGGHRKPILRVVLTTIQAGHKHGSPDLRTTA